MASGFVSIESRSIENRPVDEWTGVIGDDGQVDLTVETDPRFRNDYFAGNGLLVYCNAGLRLIDAAATTEIEESKYASELHDDLADEKVEHKLGLFVVTKHVPQPNYHGSAKTPDYYRSLDINYDDIVDMQRASIFAEGLIDVDLPWTFGSFLAQTALDSLVQQGKVDAYDAAQLSLHDWADLIDRPELRRLVQDFTFTAPGVIGPLGSSYDTYRPHTLRDSLYRMKLCTFMQLILETDGHPTELFRLNKTVREALRARMRDDGSRGCPVGHMLAKLAVDEFKNSRHAQSLIDRGEARVFQQTDDSVSVLVTRKPIEVGLDTLSSQLRMYEARYGTPYSVDRVDCRVRHEQKDYLGIFA